MGDVPVLHIALSLFIGGVVGAAINDQIRRTLRYLGRTAVLKAPNGSKVVIFDDSGKRLASVHLPVGGMEIRSIKRKGRGKDNG